MQLFRPIGIEELLLIHRSGRRAFPPRLVDQPIFYPVLNRDYAVQIARDWNTKSGSFAGFVTAFDIDDAYGQTFDVQCVGARMHQELWVPAEALKTFNAQLTSLIEVTDAFFGPDFQPHAWPHAEISALRENPGFVVNPVGVSLSNS